MDRNMRSSYVNSGPRSLPHMGGKRHNGNARLSPPIQPNHQDDIIHYIYDSWNKVSRDLERGNDEAKYFEEHNTPMHLANFRPFNLEELWARRLIQSINRNKHRS